MNQTQFAPFQPMYQTPYNYFPNQTPQRNQQQHNGIVWVQGNEGAKAFQLEPNTNVILLDSENPFMYIKSSDSIGMCTLRTFKYSEIQGAPKLDTTMDLSNYVTKDELNEAITKIIGGGQNERAVPAVESKSTSSKSK